MNILTETTPETITFNQRLDPRYVNPNAECKKYENQGNMTPSMSTIPQ
jgi:hypothetical protein